MFQFVVVVVLAVAFAPSTYSFELNHLNLNYPTFRVLQGVCNTVCSNKPRLFLPDTQIINQKATNMLCGFCSPLDNMAGAEAQRPTKTEKKPPAPPMLSETPKPAASPSTEAPATTAAPAAPAEAAPASEPAAAAAPAAEGEAQPEATSPAAE